MFDIESGWRRRFDGTILPAEAKLAGWLVGIQDDDAFVEPHLRIVQGEPSTARVIVVAAPGAVGKSTYARTLGSRLSSVVVDLSKTEPLGGNFFVGGIANAFGFQALSDAAEGRLGLVVDALDEAQLRSGSEGFAAGLQDLGKVVRSGSARPAVLFGRAAAAEEAWLVLEDAGLDPCLMEIDFFDDAQSLEYISRKLPQVAGKRQASKSAYERHGDSFKSLAMATREKLTATPEGSDKRFAGYAPVLDAICSFAVEGESEGLNPQARASQLTADRPVALIREIAQSILLREQDKLVAQLREDGALGTFDSAALYSPEEQLGRVAASILRIAPPATPPISDTRLREAYEKMIGDFSPQHPFLDGRSGPSNAAFAAYVLYWGIKSGHAPEEVRKRLAEQPGLNSGLFFELYMDELRPADDISLASHLPLADVGPLYAALASQAAQGQAATLDVTGDAEEALIGIEFEVSETDEEGGSIARRSYGPFSSDSSSVLEIRGPLSNVRVSAPIEMIIGDGSAVNITAPAEIDVRLIDIDGKEFRVFRSVGNVPEPLQVVSLAAEEVLSSRVERVSVLGGKLSASFPGANAYPWAEYSVTAPAAANEAIGTLRRRLRRILTAFRSHSKGALVRLAAKIDHARMMKRDELGPRLLGKLLEDGILSTFDSGKFYVLDQDRMAEKLSMDYHALQQQRWSPEADAYLEAVGA